MLEEDELFQDDFPNKRRRTSDIEMLCGHCGLVLCLKTYRRHKKLYFDEVNNEWITDNRINSEGVLCVECESAPRIY